MDGLNGVTEEKAAYLKIDEKKLYNLNTREKKIGGKTWTEPKKPVWQYQNCQIILSTQKSCCRRRGEKV